MASGYAAIDAMITCPTVPASVIQIVLKKYLENGTHESSNNIDKSLKLSNVGFWKNSLGGYINNSASGLKAAQKEYTSGYALNKPNKQSKINSEISPATLRLTLFFFFIFLKV